MLTSPKLKDKWQEAIEYFLMDRVDLSKSTARVYRDTLNRFSADVGVPFHEVGRLHILKFLLPYENSRTYNSNAAAIKSFYQFVADYYNIPNPAEKVKMKRKTHDVNRRCVTKEEYDLVASQPPGKARDIAVLLANTGMRINELCTLAPERCFDDHVIVHGKGNKIRTIPLNHAARDSIQRLLPNISMSTDNARDHLRRFCKKLGIRFLNPHAFRHFFASYLICQKRANIATVSKLLGHDDVNITISTYYHPDDLAGVVDLLDD